MEDEIKRLSEIALPIFTDIKGRDLNKVERENWVTACKQGIKLAKSSLLGNVSIVGQYIQVDEIDGRLIIDNNPELKEFEVWKEWRNTPTESDRSYTISFTRKLDSVDKWETIPSNSVIYNDLLYYTQHEIPVDSGSTLHSRYSDYNLFDRIYRLTWVKDEPNIKPIIERKL